MIEHIREQQLALYASGDLPVQENRTVSAHLGDCSECQKALAEFQTLQQFLTSSLQDPDAEELSQVRASLAAHLRPQPTSTKYRAWWGAGFAATAAALALLVLPHRWEHREPVAISKAPPATLAANIAPGPALQIPLAPVIRRHRTHGQSPRAGIRDVTLITQADREPVLKMTTADPNVVILWQINQKSEQKP